jgi:hypothetical protein
LSRQKDAVEFVERASFSWHQQFSLVPGGGVTPGRSRFDPILEKVIEPARGGES